MSSSIYIKNYSLPPQDIGPNNITNISSGIMRYVSLSNAEKGIKIALAAQKVNDNYHIFGQPITTSSSTNDKWRMIQLVFGKTPFFYFYHCESGLCLARKDNNPNLTLVEVTALQKVDLTTFNLEPRTSGFFGVWQLRGDERGMFLLAPDLGFFDGNSTYNINMENGKINIGDKCTQGNSCQSPEEFCLTNSKNIKPQIRTGTAAPSFIGNGYSPLGSNPVYGNIWITIQPDNSVIIGSVKSENFTEMVCTGVVQSGDKSIDWYMLPQQDPCNDIFGVPVRSSMSLGEFFSWDPEKDVNSSYNRSRMPLLPRFIDKNTQIVPEQSEYPKITAITQDPNAVDCASQFTSIEMFKNTITMNWQYIDIYAYFGGDQGYAPPEFKNITPDFMGLQGDLSKKGPGPNSGAPFQSNTTNLYTYIDGKRSAGLGGRVSIPPKWMIDVCHKNGVKCFGCIFFQEIYYGGKWGWWVQFTQDPELSAKRMIDIATYYGFDGWTFNFESGPPDEALYKPYPGQVYAGINSFTGEPVDDYWCNVIAGSKYDAWRHTQGENSSCGNEAVWPCSCTVNDGSWPAPTYAPKATPTGECGNSNNGYTQGCNDGWSVRNNMKMMLKFFRKLKADLNIDLKLFVYDTIQVTSPYGVGISTVDPALCPDGIMNTGQCFGNLDFWLDESGPLVDYMYSMRSGYGGPEPSTSPLGVTSTYLLSQNKKIVEPYWPKNTGPEAAGGICQPMDHSKIGIPCQQNQDCGTNGMCATLDTKDGSSYCVPYIYHDYACNYGNPLDNSNIPDGRAYDYFQALQLEDIPYSLTPSFPITIKQLGDFLATMTKQGNPTGWDSALFCGSQSQTLTNLGYGQSSGICLNEIEATEKPLASLNMYYIDTVWRWFNSFTNLSGYPNKQSIVDFIVQNQLVYWTGARMLNKNSRINIGTSADYWKGISHYVSEKSSSSNFPFYTCFSLGCGTKYFKDGYILSSTEWSNTSLQSILPTWMWCPNDSDINDASYINISFYGEDAYQASHSLKFITIKDPSAWLRPNMQTTCTVDGNSKTDCGKNDQNSCTMAGCCWDDTVDPNAEPWCYNKGNTQAFPLLPTKNVLTSTYKLYKLQLPTNSGCKLSITYKMISGISSQNISMKIGYSTKNITEPLLFEVPSSQNNFWNCFKLNVPASDDIINCLWLQVNLPFDFFSHILVGEICIVDKIIKIPKNPNINVENIFTTLSTGSTSCTLTWDPIDDVEYYNIFADNILIGQYYQGYQGKNRFSDRIKYKIHGQKNNTIYNVTSIHNQGPFVLPKSEKNNILLFIVYLILFILTYIIINKYYGLKTALIACGILGLIIFLYYFFTEPKTDKNSKKGALENFQIEMWQDCKEHVFNACFDDARVKAWRWLIYQAKKRNWPIKFSFFYNTLWITRDYYVLREWINLGHEISCHLHEHISMCDYRLTDQYVIDQAQLCANLIRKLYNDPNKELMVAWPHGAFPLIDPRCAGWPDPTKLTDCPMCSWSSTSGADCSQCKYLNQPCDPTCQESWGNCADGTCDSRTQQGGPMDGIPRTKVIDALSKLFIGGRQADSSTSSYYCNTWPNPASLTGVYPNSYWQYSLSPIWGFPYQIDASPGSAESFKDSYEKATSIKNGMVIFAGHTFNPYDDVTGKVVPCDSTFMNAPSDYVCPKGIQDIALSCYQNTPTSMTTLYVDNDPSKGLSDPTFPPNQNTQLQPPTPEQLANCHQCFDSCWEGASGKSVIDFFDMVTENQDLFWFATYTNILQYMYNRQNSKLSLLSIDDTKTILQLECGKMYNCDLTISLGSNPIKNVVLMPDNKALNLLTTKDGVNYIKFTPETNKVYRLIATVQ